MKRLRRLVKASDSASLPARHNSDSAPDAPEGETREKADAASDGGAASSALQRPANDDPSAALQVHMQTQGKSAHCPDSGQPLRARCGAARASRSPRKRSHCIRQAW